MNSTGRNLFSLQPVCTSEWGMPLAADNIAVTISLVHESIPWCSTVSDRELVFFLSWMWWEGQRDSVHNFTTSGPARASGRCWCFKRSYPNQTRRIPFASTCSTTLSTAPCWHQNDGTLPPLNRFQASHHGNILQPRTSHKCTAVVLYLESPLLDGRPLPVHPVTKFISIPCCPIHQANLI